jgi:hypothetical protein
VDFIVFAYTALIIFLSPVGAESDGPIAARQTFVYASEEACDLELDGVKRRSAEEGFIVTTEKCFQLDWEELAK